MESKKAKKQFEVSGSQPFNLISLCNRLTITVSKKLEDRGVGFMSGGIDASNVSDGLSILSNFLTLSEKFMELKGKNNFSWLEGEKAKARASDNLQDVRATYENIISTFQQDNADLENIAGRFKDMYEQIFITDEDIELLHNTLKSFVEVMASTEMISEEDKVKFDVLIKLVSKDLLKTMQLLGFNYKEAIGQPLTIAVSNMIFRGLTGYQVPQQYEEYPE